MSHHKTDSSMITLHMLPIVQLGFNNPFTNVTDKAKYYMNTPDMLSLIYLGLIFLSQKLQMKQSPI